MNHLTFAIMLTILLTPLLHAEGDRKLESEITLGKRYSFHSKTLDEDHQYRVILPEDYYKQNRSRTYPIIYVLDGYDRHALTTYQLASNYWRWGVTMPAPIVVGLPSNNRRRDYTPIHSTKGIEGEQRDEFLETGGGEKYREFLRQDFIPHIEKHYRTNGHRILIGHSFGGLFALNDMLSTNKIFNSYITIDPSLWFGDKVLQNKLEAMTNASLTFTGHVYIASALRGVDVDNMELHQARRDKENRFEVLSGLLNRKGTSKLSVKLDMFDREDHVSVLTAGIYEGLGFIFDGYLPLQSNNPRKTKRNAEIYDEIAQNPSLLVEHFEAFSERVGVVYPPDERFLIRAGSKALQMRAYEQAKKLLQLGTQHYPKYPVMWYGWGEYYELIGNPLESLAAYEHVLELDPDDDYAQKKIAELSERLR